MLMIVENPCHNKTTPIYIKYHSLTHTNPELGVIGYLLVYTYIASIPKVKHPCTVSQVVTCVLIGDSPVA